MKKILFIILSLSIISFVFMILGFLALNDISHDYLSKKVLISENIITGNNNIEKIPEWTKCKSEWRILQIDFISRIIFFIIITLLVIILIIKSNKKQ